MPRVVDRDQKRAEVLEGAISVIARHGLDGVRLIDIAREVGATTGTIGYYFRDKDELLVEALRFLADKIIGRNAGQMTMFLGDLGLYLPLEDDARKYWSVWLAYCGAAAASPALLDAYRGFYQSIEDSVAEHLHGRGNSAPRDTAGAIVAAVDGIGLCATVAPDLWPEERQISTLRMMINPLLSDRAQGDT